MPRCSASSCRNMGSHTFPKDPYRRTLWEKAMNKENFKATKHSRLCSDHFLPSDYVDVRCLPAGTSPSYRYLKKIAVPSIFLSKSQQSVANGPPSAIKARTASRQQITRHLRKGVVPSIFPWTKNSSSSLSDAAQQQKVSSLQNTRCILKKGVIPSVFPWSSKEYVKSKERKQYTKQKLKISSKIFEPITFALSDTFCHSNESAAAISKDSIDVIKDDITDTSHPTQNKNHFSAYKPGLQTICKLFTVGTEALLYKNEGTPAKDNVLKKSPVLSQNATKEQETNSAEINNSTRNKSVRLRNRKAFLLNRRCSVPHCNIRPTNEISLHPCPNIAAVRNEWAEALRVSYQYVKNMVACSLHFTKLDFIQSKKSERVLKYNAVPSCNLQNRKKIPVKHKFVRKDTSKALDRQKTMTDTVCQTKEPVKEEQIRECRACLKKLDDKISCCNVFQAWAPPWEGMEATIAEDLAKLASIEISLTDRHSKVLCAPCYQRLLEAATFASTVRHSDLLLRMRFTAEIDMEKVWPKPIQVDKNINGAVFNNSMDIEIKQEVVSDDEFSVNRSDNPYIESELANLDIKIEPEELVEPPPLNITINGTISLDPLNSENKDLKNGSEIQQETNYLHMEVKQEPISEGEQEIEQAPDLSLECLLCTRSFNSVTGLKAHVIAQHSYKTVKRKANGSVSPEKKRCDQHLCAICKRSFQTSTDLMVHETCHNKHVCYGCTEKFDTFELLTRHRKRCKASMANSVQKLKTLDDVKRPLPEETAEYLEIKKVGSVSKFQQEGDIEMEELETKHKQNNDIDMNIPETINKNDKINELNSEWEGENSGENKLGIVIQSVESNKKLESDDKSENVIKEVDNIKKLECKIETKENDKQLEIALNKVDNDKKIENVIKEMDIENKSSVIEDTESDNKKAESEKEVETGTTENENKGDADSNMKLHLEIHSTNKENEPGLSEADNASTNT